MLLKVHSNKVKSSFTTQFVHKFTADIKCLTNNDVHSQKVKTAEAVRC